MTSTENKNEGKTIVVLGCNRIAKLFKLEFPCATVYNTSSADSVIGFVKPDLVVFTGGSDIIPTLYGKPLPERPPGRYFPSRDYFEYALGKYCKDFGIPMVGICRGSQMLGVLHGHELVEHIDNHTRPHDIIVNEKDQYITINVSSTHHQCVNHRLCKEEFVVLGWENKMCGMVVPEVMYYPDTRSFGVQYHPEFMLSSTEGYKYFVSKVSELLDTGKIGI